MRTLWSVPESDRMQQRGAAQDPLHVGTGRNKKVCSQPCSGMVYIAEMRSEDHTSRLRAATNPDSAAALSSSPKPPA